MKSKILFFLFIFLFKHVFCKRYTNYTLFRSIPYSPEQLEFLINLRDMYTVDYWREPGAVNKTVEFMVAPEDKTHLLSAAANKHVDLTTIIEDVQSAFDRQTVATYIRRRLTSFDWTNFYRLNDIYTWLKDLAYAHPGEVKVLSIGKTFEKRDILIVKVNLGETQKRSTVIVEGGIHAREWVAPAFVTYLIHQIVNAPASKNPVVRKIASTYEWVFLPVANPDGYEYTHTSDRLWRKNRNNYHGVDINRNFDIAFGTIGVSHTKTQETYCGDRAFSELESQAMAKMIRNHAKNLEYYLAFHSYGQYLILPYAHLRTHDDNFDQVAALCRTANKAISKRFGTIYTIGTAYDTVGYSTSGVSGCWTKAQFRVPYVITFELRDTGRDGFALPPNQIMPTCLETFDGVMSLLSPTGKYGKLSNPSTDFIKFNGAQQRLLNKIILVLNVVFVILRLS